MKRKKIVIGIFCDGKLIIPFNKVECTPEQAELCCCILDNAKSALLPGHYFAFDYITE